jgi:FtsZ-binding cell division protein ZapB
MSIKLVLTELYVDKQWVLNGESYSGLNWLDDSPKPTEAELLAQVATAQAKQTAQTEISELKGKLQATDYVALADYDQDKTDVKAQRQVWRERIRELEGQIS